MLELKLNHISKSGHLCQHNKAAVSFDVCDFLFKFPKISEEKCKGYIWLATMKAPSLKASNAIVS